MSIREKAKRTLESRTKGSRANVRFDGCNWANCVECPIVSAATEAETVLVAAWRSPADPPDAVR